MTDLDVDVGGLDRARAVTAVLAACVADADGLPWTTQAIAQWTLPERLQALLAVRLASGRTHVTATVTCPACGLAMELDVDVRALVLPPLPALITVTTGEGQEVVLRVPRGTDQARWIDAAIDEPADIAGALITTIDGVAPATDFRAPTHWMDDLDAALRERDPLTALAPSASCPECGTTSGHDIDLEALLLADIAREQRQLFAEVYRLAATFHWTERDIIAMPRWRRRRYLEEVDVGGWP